MSAAESSREQSAVSLREVEEAYLDCLLIADETTDETGDDRGDEAGAAEKVAVAGVETTLECIDETGKDETGREQGGAEESADTAGGPVMEDTGIDELSVSVEPVVCQLVSVAGVKLAIPLSRFSRVIDMPDTLTVNTGETSCCSGKFLWQEKPVFLLSMEKIIFNRNRAECKDTRDVTTMKTVLLPGDKFAFACDEVLEVVSVNPSEVTWRDEKSERLWLAGTVSGAGFAILDTQGLLQAAAKL